MKIKETCTPDASKERLEEAVWPLLLERPYDEVAVDDICARAGLTKGAFYNRFSSKEEFFSHTYVKHLLHSFDNSLLEASVLYAGNIEKQLEAWLCAFAFAARGANADMTRLFFALNAGAGRLKADGSGACHALQRLEEWQKNGLLRAAPSAHDLWGYINAFQITYLNLWAQKGEWPDGSMAHAFAAWLTQKC